MMDQSGIPAAFRNPISLSGLRGLDIDSGKSGGVTTHVGNGFLVNSAFMRNP